MTTATITIPDDLASQFKPYLGSLDEVLRIGLRELKKEQGLVLFNKGSISLWKAARLSGVSLREMAAYAAAQGLRASVDEEMIQEECDEVSALARRETEGRPLP